MLTRHTLLATACALVCAHAHPARADLAAIYVQGNGGVTSGTVDELGSGSAALGARIGARVLVGELYLDRAGLASTATTTRYILGVHGGIGLAGISLQGSAGLGYLREDSTVEPMTDRDGAVARVGGALETGLHYGVHAGAALEAESFVAGASGSDVFGYLYLKLQLGI